jgi:hypothetical protein
MHRPARRADVFCPGCGTRKAIDLRTLDRHPLASVGTLVARPAMLVVSGVDTDAEADWAICSGTGQAGGPPLLMVTAASACAF